MESKAPEGTVQPDAPSSRVQNGAVLAWKAAGLSMACFSVYHGLPAMWPVMLTGVSIFLVGRAVGLCPFYRDRFYEHTYGFVLPSPFFIYMLILARNAHTSTGEQEKFKEWCLQSLQPAFASNAKSVCDYVMSVHDKSEFAGRCALLPRAGCHLPTDTPLTCVGLLAAAVEERQHNVEYAGAGFTLKLFVCLIIVSGLGALTTLVERRLHAESKPKEHAA